MEIPPGPLSATTARALSEFLARLAPLAGLSVRPPLELAHAGGRAVLRDAAPPELWARLIAHAGAGAYSWQEVWSPLAGVWEDSPTGLSGVGNRLPAYEAGGATNVAAGTRVWLRLAEGGRHFVFDHPGC